MSDDDKPDQRRTKLVKAGRCGRHRFGGDRRSLALRVEDQEADARRVKQD